MTNELNRVHQAEALEGDNNIHEHNWATKIDSVEAGVEWIYAGLFSNTSIWREKGCEGGFTRDLKKGREFVIRMVTVDN